MRLPSKYVVTRSTKAKKKKEEKKKINKESKKQLSPLEKVNKNYSNNTPVNTPGRLVPLCALHYGYIKSCKAIGIIVDGETIELENNWIELIGLMLETLRSRCKTSEEFMDMLIYNGVITPKFFVGNKYGKISTDEKLYTYKLSNIGVYIEMVYTDSTIFEVIALLALTLQLTLKTTYIKVQSYGYENDSLGVKIDDEYIELDEITPAKLYATLESGRFIYKVIIEDKDGSIEDITQKRADIIGYELATWIYDNLGEDRLRQSIDKIKELNTTKSGRIKSVTTGIRLGKSLEYGSSPIRNSNIYMYSNGELSDDCKFIKDMTKVTPELSKGLKIYFKKQKTEEEKAEWEI